MDYNSCQERLENSFRKCYKMLKAINAPIGKLQKIKINNRLSRAAGRCDMGSNNKFTIEISGFALRDALDKVLDEIIMHEIIHTFPNCYNHGKEFKRWADKINKIYNYNIEIILKKQEWLEKSSRKPKYIFKCEKCGSLHYRFRKSYFTEHYELYSCKCGGKLIKVENNTQLSIL